MKTILLADCTDLLPAGETAPVAKPMIEVAGRPVITRVMDIYSRFGYTDFIVSTCHKALEVKQFFTNYHLMANDVRVSIDTGKVELRPTHGAGWTVSVVDTGLYNSSSGQLRMLRDWVGNETFMVSYADGLGNIDIQALIDFHYSHGKLATVTAVRPPARLGGLELRNNRVTSFSNRLHSHDAWINGGFFVFEPSVFDYLTDDQEPLESSPMSQLSLDGELMAMRHFGFWHPMDTLNDRRILSRYCMADIPPWLDFAPPHLRPVMHGQ
ncbi:MAG: sugar phosphate nucleotidyltransferase [Paracoccus sp. (in: a-proteobacteria)]